MKIIDKIIKNLKENRHDYNILEIDGDIYPDYIHIDELKGIFSPLIKEPKLSKKLKETRHHSNWNFCPGCGEGWESDFDNCGCWICGFIK